MPEARSTTTLVVPCYNEAHRLPRARFLEALQAQPSLHLIFVDDGSTDGTLEVLRSLVAEAPGRADLLHLGTNQGKAEAVRRGMQAALEGGQCAIVGYWDADLATPLEEVEALSAPLIDPRVQLVLGARVKMLGRDVQRRAWRHYLGRVAATAASWVVALPVYDTQCGAKLMRADDDAAAIFATPFHTRWAFDVEILARWLRDHPGVRGAAVEAHIVEVPLRTWHDIEGSKIRLTDVLKTPLDLLRIWWAYR